MSTLIQITKPTELIVNNTPIIGGVDGRVLFQGTGNVLQQSSSLFWDNTGFLGIGTSTPVAPSTYNGITINSATAGSYVWFQTGGVTKYTVGSESNVNYHNLVAGTSFLIRSGGSSYFNVVQSTGNVQIGTTTDAGYKLDVNGTARITGQTTFGTTGTDGSIRFLRSIDASNVGYIQVNSSGLQVGNGTYAFFHNNSLNGINAGSNPLAMWHIKGSGNTSSTTSLLVQQSTGVNVLSVRDDMYVTVQNTNNTECFQVRGANDDATIRFTPSGGTGSIILKSQSSSITLSTTANSFGDLRVNGGGQTLRIGTSSLSGGGVNYYSSQNGTTHSHRWFHNNVEQMSLQYTGNFLIGTTTDAGFKLDVNGTARVSGNLTLGAEIFGTTNTYFTGPSLNTGTLWLRFNAVNSNGNFTATGPVQGTNVIASGTNSQLSSTGAGVQGVLISNTATSTNWRIEGHRTTSGALEFKNDLTNPVLNLFSSRNVGIGTFTDVASAKLIIESTTQGFLPPRMTTTQKNAIATPAAGLVVYDTTLAKLCVYTTTWETITSA